MAGTLAGLLALEGGLRVRAALLARGVLHPGRELPADPLPGTRVTLGQVIRRSADPEIVYELRPNLDVVFEGARLTTSGNGVRGHDPGFTRTPGTSRIVGLGDSFLFGYGVGDDQTHLALLEKRLQASGSPAEVVNLGVPGYNAVMEVRTFETRGIAYAPDLVLIEFLGNDFDLPNFIAPAPDVSSLRKSFLVDFVRERLRRRGRPDPWLDLVEAPRRSGDAESFVSDPAAVPPEYRDLVGWEAVDRAYRRLDALARGHGCPVVLLHWESSAADWRLVHLAERLGFPSLNLSRVLESAARERGLPAWEGSPFVRSASDHHPSALGHEVIAGEIERFLRTRGLVPPITSPGPMR